MGIMSVSKVNHLLWLGRYCDRVFSTVRRFYHNYDTMLEADKEAYIKFCNRLAIPNIYKDKDDFVARYPFDMEEENSIISNLGRAYDNALVMRDEISSETLSYIELALNTMKQTKEHEAPLIDLQPVLDYILAFWGCVDDYVNDQDTRNILKTGKYIERIDLYLRLGVESSEIQLVVRKLVRQILRTRLPYDEDALDDLIIATRKEEVDTSKALECLDKLLAGVM